MAGKKKPDKDKTWVGEMESYSRQIWLAGLGAYAKMGKEDSKLFDTLVKDGEQAEKAARSEIDRQVKMLKERVGKSSKAAKDPVETARSKVEKSRGKLLKRWGEFESVFDKRLQSAVSRLGVPSRDEIKALEDKVDALSRSVVELLERRSPPAKLAPKVKPAAVATPVVSEASGPVVEKLITDPAEAKPKTAPRRRSAGGAGAKPVSQSAAKRPAGKSRPNAASAPGSEPVDRSDADSV